MIPSLSRSLRAKLIALFLAPTLLITSLYGLTLYTAARASLEEELGLRLTSTGQALAGDLSRGVEASQLARLDPTKERTRARIQQRLEAIRQDTQLARIFLFDPSLNSLVDTAPDVQLGQRLFELDADRFEIQAAIDSQRSTTSVLFTGSDTQRYKTAYVPVLLKQEVDDDGELITHATPRVVAVVGIVASAQYFTLLNEALALLATLAILSALLMGSIGAIFSRRLTSPLHKLVHATQRLERGELEVPILSQEELVRARSGDEVDSLAISFEEMRRAVLSRDQQMQMMLSGIAHEVRNPLGGMELFCGLLREDLEAEPAPDLDKLDKVRRIERELTYLSRVVTDFLEFARHRPVQLERFDATDFLTEISMLLCAEAERQGCPIHLNVAPQDLELTADRERLHRALINAARNAWQASPQGGEIIIHALVHHDDPTQRLIIVEDHGTGIPQEKLQEILTPFYTTKEKGSGLGLAMIQKVIEQHRGQLTIESELGRGTRLIFSLPFSPRAPRVEVAQGACAEPGLSNTSDASMEIPEGWLG